MSTVKIYTCGMRSVAITHPTTASERGLMEIDKFIIALHAENATLREQLAEAKAYLDTAWKILLRKPMMETYDFLVNMCLKLMRRETVSYTHLTLPTILLV